MCATHVILNSLVAILSNKRVICKLTITVLYPQATPTSHAHQPIRVSMKISPNQDGCHHREQEGGLGFPRNGGSQAFHLPLLA